MALKLNTGAKNNPVKIRLLCHVHSFKLKRDHQNLVGALEILRQASHLA